jgi:hypothetical protein
MAHATIIASRRMAFVVFPRNAQVRARAIR